MTRIPHLGGTDPHPNMHWDYRDQLSQTDMVGDGKVFYVYDSSGQRVRKVWEKAPGLTEECIYLGSYELFRRRNGKGQLTLQRETLSLMDDKQRIALVERHTSGIGPPDQTPGEFIRYQLGNHLGSASLELDGEAQIISYEEYTTYGSTSYQAIRTTMKVPKRYRYAGKERDEESGLYYHGARYYAPWLCRWTNCDPDGIVDGPNLFLHVQDNPLNFLDPDGRQTIGPYKFSPEVEALIDLPEGGWGVPTNVTKLEIWNRFPPEFQEDLYRVAREQKKYDEAAAEIRQFYTPLTDILLRNPELGPNPVETMVREHLGSRPITEGQKILRTVEMLQMAAGAFASLSVMTPPSTAKQTMPQGSAPAAPNPAAVPPLAAAPSAAVGSPRPTNPMAGTTDAEIEAAVNSPGRSNVMVQGPAPGRLDPHADVVTAPYGTGQKTLIKTQAPTSAPNQTGWVRTLIKVHDADAAAAAKYPGSNSGTGTTLSIEQGGGNRRLIPDSTSPTGGRWIDSKTATSEEWNAAHIPIFR